MDFKTTKQTQVRSTEEAPARSALKLALKELDEGHIYLAYGYIQEALASEAIEHPAQTDWEAVAADQAMTIALLRAEQPAQRTWVGLTDDDYRELHLEMGPTYFYQDYGRAIEAKLKEKNT